MRTGVTGEESRITFGIRTRFPTAIDTIIYNKCWGMCVGESGEDVGNNSLEKGLSETIYCISLRRKTRERQTTSAILVVL